MKIYVMIFQFFITIILEIAKQTLHLKNMKLIVIFRKDNKNVKKPTASKKWSVLNLSIQAT